MSTRAIQVRAWDDPVGVVAPDLRSGAYAFRYYPTWLKKGVDLAPLTMPVAQGDVPWVFPTLHESYKRLPALLADALPDDFGNALIDAWMSSRGISRDAITELDRLAYMGRRGMGALEFQPAEGPTSRDAEIPIALKNLVEEARMAIGGGTEARDAASALKHILQVGTSAGGARAKAVIAWNPDTNEIRSGQFEAPSGFSHWLIKLDGVGRDAELGRSEGYGRIEYAYHLMATEAGIRMSDCALLEEGGKSGRAHFLTRRFDRDGDRKIHMQTLSAMTHMSHLLKATHAYEQYFMTVRSLGLGDLAAKEAFRRLVFNVAARNHDDHTKNFGFLLRQGGAWELAPAYDVTYAYNPRGQWTSQHLMSVNGKFDGITRDDLLVLADRFAIPAADDVIDHVAATVADWPRFAQKAKVSPENLAAIGASHVRLEPARRRAAKKQARADKGSASAGTKSPPNPGP